MTLEKLKKEARGAVENYIDDILFYLCEYRNEIDISDIATIFTQTYHDMIWKIAEELESEVE